MMRSISKPALILIILLSAMRPRAAHAQDAGRISLSFLPAIASMDGDTEFAFAATAGYRFTQHVSFETDITWINAAAGGFRNHILEVPDRRVTASNTINNVLQFANPILGGGNR